MPKLDQNILFDNRYLLLRKLGSGGYSEVWLAHDNKVDIDIALKIFAPDKGMDEKGIELFSKEYSLVFNLNNSYLLKPSHFNDFEGSPYLVLPYCKNGSVLDKIGEMSEQEFGKFMLQAASALDYLHDQNPPIIHQDIKPDNFLIDDKGNYLLSDFGISSRIKRVLTKSVGRLNSSGTLPYMPPERFIKERQIIKASDIFSLGVTFYEILTGELPFGEHGGLILNTGAEVPDLPSHFSPDLNKLISACMAKEPWSRPHAEQLAEIARDFLKTGQWNISSIIKESEDNSKQAREEKEAGSEKQLYKEGRKTEKISFAETSEIPIITEPAATIKSAQIHKKRKIWPFIVAGALVLAALAILCVFLVNNNNTVKTDSNKSADTLKKAVKKNTAQDTIKTKKPAAIKITENKTIIKDENKPVKKPTGEKVKLSNIYCNGVELYVSPVNNAAWATWAQARAICNNLNAYGYNDWYLPSKDELNCIFDKQSSLTGLGNHNFWSATESGDYAWSQDFTDGHQYNTDKDDHGCVRCVRK